MGVGGKAPFFHCSKPLRLTGVGGKAPGFEGDPHIDPVVRRGSYSLAIAEDIGYSVRWIAYTRLRIMMRLISAHV
jgi:hypothetical protein